MIYFRKKPNLDVWQGSEYVFKLERLLFLQKLPLAPAFKNSFRENFGKLPRENPWCSLFSESCRLKVSRIAFHKYMYEEINFSAFCLERI